MKMTSISAVELVSDQDRILGVASERRVLIVYNPVAGWRRLARVMAVRGVLDRIGCSVELRTTEHAGHAEEIARTLRPGECDVLAVAGGDGTINEVINGLSPGGPVLAVIPTGTANVLAHEMGLAFAPEAIGRLIAQAQPAPVNLGLANGRRFAMMAGVGYDAHVVAGVTPALKRRLRKLAYVWRSLVQMPTFDYRGYRVTIDGRPHEAASAIISNGRYYAGRFVCAPEARLDRAQFHVCLFKRSGPFNVMRYGLALVTNRLSTLKDFEIHPGHVVEIDGAVGEPVQADGDIIARLPVRITLAEQPLWVLRP